MDYTFVLKTFPKNWIKKVEDILTCTTLSNLQTKHGCVHFVYLFYVFLKHNVNISSFV